MKHSQHMHGWYRAIKGYHLVVVLLALLGACFLLFTPSPQASALTTVPTKMNFQGRLTDASGNIKPNGTYNLRLKLYTVSTAGSAVWSEDRLVSATQGVTVTNGLFSIQLGEITSLPASLFASGALYLEVELPTPASATTSSPVWTEGPMTPRNQMATSAYAYNAETLDGIDGAAFGQLSTANTWSGTNTFSGSVLAQSSLTLGTTSVAGALVVNDGSSNTATLQVANLAANYTYTLPVTTANDTFCFLTLANCSAAGGGVTTVGTYSTTNTAAGGATITGTTITFQDASATAPGMMGTGTQTFAGNKTFNGTLSVNDTTLAAGKSLTVTGGTTATRPASPTEGMIYFDSDTDQLLTYSNGKWQADQSDAILVAASNSSQSDKDSADYVADGNTVAALDGDQAQINAALTAASGKKVVLLAGTYVADATILIPNNTTFAGVGQGTVIELADLDATDNLIENSDTTTGTGVTIRDIKLDGRSDLNTVGTQYGTYLNGMGAGSGASARRGGMVSGVMATRFRSPAIYFMSSNNNVLRDSMTLANSSGFYFNSSHNNLVSNNTAQGNTNNGFVINTSSNNTFSGNVAQGGNYGVYMNAATNNTLTANTFQGTANVGVTVDAGSHYTVLTGNTFQSNAWYGVAVQTSNSNTISGNNFRDNGNTTNNDSIYLTAADSNTITGNTITDSSATTDNYAINIASSTSDTNYLADNTLGTGTINDLGTGTVYGGQINSSGQLVSSSSGGTVSKLQPSSTADLYQGQNSSSTALFKVTSTGAIQGTSLDTIGATALALGGTNATAININQNTTILAGKTLTIGTSTNGIILTDTGLTLAGTARGTKTVTLVPEYQGSTFRGDGTNNTGSLSSDLCSATTGGLGINTSICATANEEHNYYEWANTQATAQDYDIYVRYKLPADYNTGSMTNLKFFAQGTTINEAATLTMYSGSTQCATTGDVVTVATTWTEGTVASPLGTCTPAAGSYVTFKISLSATQNNQARAGEISLTYRSSF